MRPMRIRSRIGYLLVALLTIVFVAAYAVHRDLYGLYSDYVQSEEQVSAAQIQADALEKDLDHSRQHVHDLDSNPLEKEKTIRRTQRLVRPGEKVFLIEEGSADPSQPKTQEQSKP